MIGVLLFSLVYVVLPNFLGASHPAGFNVRFNKTGERGVVAFIDMPWNVTAAESKGWVNVVRPEGPQEYESLTMWCPSDKYTICVLFDDTEYAAGMQISVDLEKVSNVSFDMHKQGFVNWTTTVNGVTKNYASIHSYYISGDSLKTDPATRIANRNSSSFLQGNDVYISGFDGKVSNISVTGYKNSIYVEENCYPQMGGHYYYNVTAEMICADDKISPWVILVDGGEFVGLSLQMFAQIEESELDWLEYYGGEKFLRAILRAGSDCVFKLGNFPGLTVLHIWFIENPYDITC